MADGIDQGDGPRISERKREAQRKATEAAARRRREQGMTQAQRDAVKRMQEGRKAAAEQKRRIREGGATPVVHRPDGAPHIEPGTYPERPARAPQAAPAPEATQTPPQAPAAQQVPAQAAQAPRENVPPPTTNKEPAWSLRRALGMRK